MGDNCCDEESYLRVLFSLFLDRILKAVEEIGASAPLTDGSLKVTTPNLIVLATLAEPAMFPGLALVAERDSDNQFQDDKV